MGLELTTPRSRIPCSSIQADRRPQEHNLNYPFYQGSQCGSVWQQWEETQEGAGACTRLPRASVPTTPNSAPSDAGSLKSTVAGMFAGWKLPVPQIRVFSSWRDGSQTFTSMPWRRLGLQRKMCALVPASRTMCDGRAQRAAVQHGRRASLGTLIIR